MRARANRLFAACTSDDLPFYKQLLDSHAFGEFIKMCAAAGIPLPPASRCLRLSPKGSSSSHRPSFDATPAALKQQQQH